MATHLTHLPGAPAILSLRTTTIFRETQTLTAASPPRPPIETNARQSIADATKNPPKIHHQLTNIQFILSHQKSKQADLSSPAHRIEGQNLPLLSPFSDFPPNATKSPLRVSPSNLTFVQFNCKDKKTKSLPVKSVTESMAVDAPETYARLA